MLKASQFNHMVKVPGTEHWALYNFATGSLARLNEVQKGFFEMSPDLPETLHFISKWKEAGFLTDTDEAVMIEERIMGEIRRMEQTEYIGPLILKIYVTSACNFACPYCFQYRRGSSMTPSVQEAVIAFVKNRLQRGCHDSLTVFWYGGEPLLEPGIIETLSRRLMDLADSFQVPYSAGIITNAWFLDQSMVDLLESLKVQTAYVTVDGIGEYHDRTRLLSDGSPTFDRIYNNLKSIRTSMFISLRCNLHSENLKDFGALSDLAEQLAEETGNQIRCVPGKMVDTSAVKARHIKETRITPEDLQWAYQRAGYIEKKDVFRPRLSFCHRGNPFSYLIDEEGDVFPNCNYIAADKHRAVGNLLSDQEEGYRSMDRAMFSQVRKWALPKDSSKCMTCSRLLACYGGCWGLYELDGRRECPERLADPDAYVLRRYYSVYGTDVKDEE